MQFLERARERGDIGAFGMATDVSTIASALESAPAYASVIQFANNEREPSLERNPLLRRHACITHSPFRGAESATTDAMRAALSFALADNPSGIVLFGSQSVQHVVSNASALE
jgi:aryl-alcohol dehydrogenase-like predicted oxidoreductase